MSRYFPLLLVKLNSKKKAIAPNLTNFLSVTTTFNVSSSSFHASNFNSKKQVFPGFTRFVLGITKKAYLSAKFI